jgi:hypothetical protein
MSKFSVRRAIERLRDGLFDTVAVERLTMEEHQIKNNFSKGLEALEKERSGHLCICGAYGQGKSHTLNYLHQHALSQGYATSFVQLDIREIPFHQFSVVYQALMTKLSLPDGEKFVAAWKRWDDKDPLEFLNTMPHRFQMILTALLQQQKESSHLLEKALMGHDLPLTHLKSILKAQGIEGYKKQSLRCCGNIPYVQMVQALGKLLKEMGYKGLVLFFDEAESIAQGRLTSRAKSYAILDQFFQSKSFVYPVFALTDDFFDRVNQERYDDEKQTFSQNYSETWKNLNVARLQNSSDGWDSLQNRLIQLYAEAYQIDIPNQMTEIKQSLQKLLSKLNTQETRFKLKALVHQLDIETQQLMQNQ